MRIICLIFLCALSVASVSFAGQLTRLYAFTGGADGKYPYGPLLLDSAGNLYGVTLEGGIGYGTVFRLSPPLEEGAPWTETVLHTFAGGPSDGASPGGNLILDFAGNLYGVAGAGGLTTCLGGSSSGCGVAFRISPSLEYTILYEFGRVPLDGWDPQGQIAMDTSGAIYGATTFGGLSTYSSGTVFKLTPPTVPGGTWTESVLHVFGTGTDGFEPFGGVTFNADGSLFGTTLFGGTFGRGTVFELSPPPQSGGVWAASVLHDFSPLAGGFGPVSGVTFDSSGNFYGSTAESTGPRADGTVFRLNPPSQTGGPWGGSTLFEFGGQDGSYPNRSTPALDASGNLWITTASGGTYDAGTLVELAPPASSGQSWVQKLVYSFSNSWNGGAPAYGVTIGPDGTLYGTTAGGGDNSSGIVYQYKP
jgi:uncharacterized repeat protein (TIGR03803 family)